jgi:hypothetical protein
MAVSRRIAETRRKEEAAMNAKAAVLFSPAGRQICRPLA